MYDVCSLKGVSIVVVAAALTSWGREAAAGGGGLGMLPVRVGPRGPWSCPEAGSPWGVAGLLSPFHVLLLGSY